MTLNPEITKIQGSLPKSLSHVQSVTTTLEENQSIIKEHFDRFVYICIYIYIYFYV